MEWVGYIAATCTTIAFLPQVIRIVRYRNTESISLTMYLIFVAGIIFWLAYGILRNDIPIIAANAFTLLFSSVILFLKIRDQLKKRL